MLVLKTGTVAKPEIKGLDEELKGKGDVTLSGSMTRQVSRTSFPLDWADC